MSFKPKYSDAYKQIEEYTSNVYPRFTKASQVQPLFDDAIAKLRGSITNPNEALSAFSAATDKHQVPADLTAQFSAMLQKEPIGARPANYYNNLDALQGDIYETLLKRRASPEEIARNKIVAGAQGIADASDFNSFLSAKLLSTEEGAGKNKSAKLKDLELMYGPSYRGPDGEVMPLFKTPDTTSIA